MKPLSLLRTARVQEKQIIEILNLLAYKAKEKKNSSKNE